MSLSVNELNILKEVLYFAEELKINKTKLAKEVGVTATTVRNVMNKFKEGKNNVRK